MDPTRDAHVQRPMRRLNPTVIALLGGVVILVLLVAYFASNRSPNQDRLTANEVRSAQPAAVEKRCGSQSTYDLVKAELFRRAARLRGGDQAAYDRLANYAVVRMENPVLEGQDKDTGSVNCSGSLSLDLPPGIVAVGGRHTLMADVDYTVQPAADASGNVILLRNADAIITSLATLSRAAAVAPPAASTETNSATPAQPTSGAPAPVTPAPPAPPQPAQRPIGARASFDCATARTRGEVAVCSDAGLATLDRAMAAQYARAIANASPDEQALLRDTAHRFYAYRDRCADNRCVGDAYVGRMREIRDIVEGRWQPPR